MKLLSVFTVFTAVTVGNAATADTKWECTPGMYHCSTDGKSLLYCQPTGHYVKKKDCPACCRYGTHGYADCYTQCDPSKPPGYADTVAKFMKKNVDLVDREAIAGNQEYTPPQLPSSTQTSQSTTTQSTSTTTTSSQPTPTEPSKPAPGDCEKLVPACVDWICKHPTEEDSCDDQTKYRCEYGICNTPNPWNPPWAEMN